VVYFCINVLGIVCHSVALCTLSNEAQLIIYGRPTVAGAEPLYDPSRYAYLTRSMLLKYVRHVPVLCHKDHTVGIVKILSLSCLV